MIKTILVAIDGSDHANKALILAGDLAEKYDAKLVIVHVLLRDMGVYELKQLVDVDALPKEVQDEMERLEALPLAAASMEGIGTTFPLPIGADVLQAVAARIVEEARKSAADKGVKDITVTIVEGSPAEQILAAANKEDANMIVMGSRGLSNLKGMLVGSASHKVAQLCECTCITVK